MYIISILYLVIFQKSSSLHCKKIILERKLRMKVAENFLTLGSKSYYDGSLPKAISYCLGILFLCFMSFTYISVNQFISNTLSIDLSGYAGTEYEGDAPTAISSITIQNGDTLSKVLSNQNISPDEAYKIINSIKTSNITYIPKQGQKITFHYDTIITEDNQNDLTSETRNISFIDIKIDNIHHIEISRESDNFIAKDFFVPLVKKIKKTTATITNSFMTTAKSMGVSTNNVLEIINAYSYQIDFQRQIKSGDTVTLVTEQFFTEDGKFSHSGQVIFASMNLSGKDYNIYKYAPNSDEASQYFSEDGSSVKRNLLKTPMNVARISSHFGNRKHPIQGYTKMHRGVDFSAPVGTPIYSAGDGVITELGWKSGYGKFVLVKHSSTLSTAYAHASRFAKNLKIGSKIKQGQVIAYVGTTGNSTGPHLHYEVRINGKQVNPTSIKGTPGTHLTGAHRTKFEKFKHDLGKTYGV